MSSELGRELDFARRFEAPDMARAMRKLSDAFGADALILSSRSTTTGVEVLGAPAAAYEQAKKIEELQSRRASQEAKERRNPANGMRRRQLGKSKLSKPEIDEFELVGSPVVISGNVKKSVANGAAKDKVIGDYREVQLEALYEKSRDDSTVQPYENPLKSIIDVENIDDVGSEVGFQDKFNEVFDWETDSEASPDSVSTKESSLQTAEDLLQAVVASEQIQQLKREIEELKLQIQERILQSSPGHAQAIEKPDQPPIDQPQGQETDIASLLSETQVDVSAKEIRGYGLTPEVVNYILQTAAPDLEREQSEEERDVIGLRAVKAHIPVAAQSLLSKQGIIAITGGTYNQQEASLTKLALYLASEKGAGKVAVLSLESSSEELQRIGRLTGVKVLDCDGAELGQRIQQCARYPYLLIDIGGSPLSANPTGALSKLRSLNLGHREIIALAADAEPSWARENLAIWRSSHTVACLVNRIQSPTMNFAHLISWLISEKMDVAAWLDDALLPESVHYWSREEVLAKLSQLEYASNAGTIPVVY